jgi:hypothetical protein
MEFIMAVLSFMTQAPGTNVIQTLPFVIDNAAK